jgi:uncharacterized membrane protein YphA (DoxX/SURF4 family)
MPSQGTIGESICERKRNPFLLVRVLQIALGFIFIVAAAGKAWSVTHHTAVIRYVLDALSLGWNQSLAIATIMILWEALLGVYLIFDVARRPVLIATGVTLILFTLVLARLLIDPNAPNCGCFGTFQVIVAQENSPVSLVRNAALLWDVGWLYLDSRKARMEGPTSG